MNEHDFDPADLPPSRSQVRREALDVLELAERLVALSSTQLKKIPLSERVLDAVKLAHKIPSHIAHKRQVHYLAKLMRNEDDLEAIRLAVDKPLEVRRKETAALHLLERWRERLVRRRRQRAAVTGGRPQPLAN
jgi:ribosome-associated protein